MHWDRPQGFLPPDGLLFILSRWGPLLYNACAICPIRRARIGSFLGVGLRSYFGGVDPSLTGGALPQLLPGLRGLRCVDSWCKAWRPLRSHWPSHEAPNSARLAFFFGEITSARALRPVSMRSVSLPRSRIVWPSLWSRSYLSGVASFKTRGLSETQPLKDLCTVGKILVEESAVLLTRTNRPRLGLSWF